MLTKAKNKVRSIFCVLLLEIFLLDIILFVVSILHHNIWNCLNLQFYDINHTSIYILVNKKLLNPTESYIKEIMLPQLQGLYSMKQRLKMIMNHDEKFEESRCGTFQVTILSLTNSDWVKLHIKWHNSLSPPPQNQKRQTISITWLKVVSVAQLLSQGLEIHLKSVSNSNYKIVHA